MDFSQLLHVFPESAKVNQHDHLEIGGIDTVDLVKEFGTPLYVFCQNTLLSKCRDFTDSFRAIYPQTQIAYASKAYLGPALARLLSDEGLSIDVVSGGELAVAQSVGFNPERIYFHGNNKSKGELEQALDYRVGQIVVDNRHELEMLQKIAESQGRVQTILLRVTPGVDPHTHSHTTTGLLDSKFGLPLTNGAAEEILHAALRCPNLHLAGLHCHLGSPIFELEPYSLAIDLLIEFAARCRDSGFQLDQFSPGGGFAVAYTKDQHPPSTSDYAESIVTALRENCAKYDLPLPLLVVEPGRAIVGPAGIALYSVGSVKEIAGIRTYVSVDGGMGDNIRPALYDSKYEVVLANRMTDRETQRVTIAGKYCESGDVIVRDAPLPETVSGDIIAIPAAGAYSPAMASNYNMNPRPPIVFVDDGRARLVRRRETNSDMMRCDI